MPTNKFLVRYKLDVKKAAPPNTIITIGAETLEEAYAKIKEKDERYLAKKQWHKIYVLIEEQTEE